jgi:hypothetical protein
MKFINLTAHNLTADQIEAAKKLGVTEFLEAADVLPPTILEKLRNCPSDIYEISTLAIAVLESINGVKGHDNLYVHFPCGSPALMWMLARNRSEDWDFTPVFSHSVRDSVETVQPDGSISKQSVFRFEKFIIF